MAKKKTNRHNQSRALEGQIERIVSERHELDNRKAMIEATWAGLNLQDWTAHSPDEIKASLRVDENRLESAESLFLAAAIHSFLYDRPDQHFVVEEIADALGESDIELAISVLLGAATKTAHQWVEIIETGENDRPHYKIIHRNTESPIGDFQGTSLYTKEGRKASAAHLLEALGIEQIMPLEEKSPALAMLRNVLTGDTAPAHMEHQDTMLRILHLKTPTWAGARGFNESYRACLERASMVKRSGKMMWDFDGLTNLYVYTGASMYDAHCMTLGSEQVLALPPMDANEHADFVSGLHLPIEPNMFIDFSCDGKLPSIITTVSEDNAAMIAGVLVNRWDNNLIFTPLFVYNQNNVTHSPTPVGISVYNQANEPQFYWGGENHDFPDGPGLPLTLVAQTEVLDGEMAQHININQTYADLIDEATRIALRCLYFVEAANVVSVPVPLERRDVKRANKRGWRIPDTVRIDRPKRYATKSEPTGNERVYSHQFQVRGFYRHVQRGSHVRCQICKGKFTDQLPCSACNNTGINQEIIKPCSRIDETTGELTCPHGCRREWTPSFWKGPEDAPAIIKTYNVKAA